MTYAIATVWLLWFQPEDTDGQLNVQSLKLPDLGILIIWDLADTKYPGEELDLKSSDSDSG